MCCDEYLHWATYIGNLEYVVVKIQDLRQHPAKKIFAYTYLRQVTFMLYNLPRKIFAYSSMYSQIISSCILE
jgi:hypothetical protein